MTRFALNINVSASRNVFSRPVNLRLWEQRESRTSHTFTYILARGLRAATPRLDRLPAGTQTSLSGMQLLLPSYPQVPPPGANFSSTPRPDQKILIRKCSKLSSSAAATNFREITRLSSNGTSSTY